MRTLWLNFTGTADSREAFDLPLLYYPLCYNLPPTAWTMNSSIIELIGHTETPYLFVDLLVEAQQKLSNTNIGESFLAIKGYRWCIGIADHWFLNQLNSPTDRDKGVCLYYSRWPKGYNCVGPLMKISWHDIQQQNFICRVGQEKIVKNLSFDISPPKLLSFLSNFTTVESGDLASLGSLIPGKLIRKFPLSIEVELAKYSYSTEINWEN